MIELAASRIGSALRRFYNRPWLGSWTQRVGAAVLERLERNADPGRVERLATPWFARDTADRLQNP